MRTRAMRLGLLTVLLLGAVNAEARGQTPAAERQQQLQLEREQLRKIEQLHRELERATRAYYEQQAALTRESSAAQRAALASARAQLEQARASLNRELLQLMMRDAHGRQAEAPRRVYVQRTPLSADTVVFFQPVQPRGWLGVSLSTQWREEADAQGRPIWRFGAYPVIEAVEPGSPAERAGIAAGDVLVTIGGRDVVRGSAPFTELLRPGATLPIQIRRGDQLRVVHARIAARPQTSFTIVTTTGKGEGGMLQPGSVQLFYRDSGGRVSVATGTPAGRGAVVAGEKMTLVPVPAAGSSSLTVVAGAELFPIAQQFRMMGVDEGLLVLRVAPGTPTARAGVQSGDVIVAANGVRTVTAEALRSVLEGRSVKSAAVQLLRNGERHTVMLRW